MDEVEGLDDCNLIIRVGLLEQDHNEGIQQFFIRQQTSCRLTHRFRIFLHIFRLHFHQETMQDLIVTREVPPTHMFGVHSNVLHIADPETDEREEGSSSFAHSLLPAIVSEHFCEFCLCFGEHLVLFDDFVEVVFPVEHETEGCLAIDLDVFC